MGAFVRIALLVVAVGSALAGHGLAAPSSADEALPRRVARIVLHTPGGPDYGRPERRFKFLTPAETFALWSGRFGAHWIVWTDGAFWPRHPKAGESRSWFPDTTRPAASAQHRRISAEAAPVYGHVIGHNTESVGIEVAHSGRSDQPFPDAQMASLTWLLRTMFEMSGGRVGPAQVVGHKDLDSRPAYVDDTCDDAACAYYVDADGAAYRRRVDPPESLFAALAERGVVIPRPAGGLGADRELLRAQAMPPGSIPRIHR